MKGILFLILVSSNWAFLAQDIISKDGHNMGPRKYFLDVCAYDENGFERINHARGYSNLDFCNCLAEEMIPLMTKKEINYYFAQNNHTKLFEDELLSKKAAQCMISAQENFTITPPPPPQEVIAPTSVSTEALIDSIIQLVDYEGKFDQMLHEQLDKLKVESKIDDSQYTSLEKSITFNELNPEVIKNAYLDYSDDDVLSIYEYLSSMSQKELSESSVKYELTMVNYFSHHIKMKLQDALRNDD